MTNIIIFGASRGLGAAFSLGVPQRGDTVWLVSRSRPADHTDGVERVWIQADLTAPVEAAPTIADALSDSPLDVLIYNAGIWETDAFDRSYNVETVDERETLDIIAVNLTSAILCIQKLLPNLRQSQNGKVILIGSTSGLENTRSPEVAYSASKFGLRGFAHALRENLRLDRISVTCINPGDIADAAAAYNATRIPVQDLIAVVKCIMSLSNATCIKEIDIPAMTDTNV